MELGNLTNLEYIWIYLTRISGSIPVSFGNLGNMIDMRLFANYLSGPLSQVHANLTNLVIVDLSKNRFTGKLPDLCQEKFCNTSTLGQTCFMVLFQTATDTAQA